MIIFSFSYQLFQSRLVTNSHRSRPAPVCDLALARANRIKEKLVEAGLDPSKIKTALGDPQGGMNADYKITTTTIK